MTSKLKRATLIYDEVLELAEDRCICFDSRDRVYILLSLVNENFKELARYKEITVIKNNIVACRNLDGYIEFVNGTNIIIEDSYLNIRGYNGTLVIAENDKEGRVDIINIDTWKNIGRVWSDYVLTYYDTNYYIVRTRNEGLDRLFDSDGNLVINDNNTIALLKNNYALAVFNNTNSIKLVDLKNKKSIIGYEKEARYIINLDGSIDIYAVINSKVKHWEKMKPCIRII